MTPRKLGRYELLSELGRGAMGVVYYAIDPILNRPVAIKTINMAPDDDAGAEYEARFYQEARAAGGLNHPGIVTIYDIGNSENVVYMAMEYLEGNELRALLSGGARLPLAQSIRIAAQVADGLAYAHRHGVVHRDIKPTNIMIAQDGHAKLTDFGIARMRSAKSLTQTGTVLGSPMYMSPEQIQGKRADPRSDIFSLGTVLYEMLTGKTPFAGADVEAMMFQVLHLVPPPVSMFNRAIPVMLDLIVAKALSKMPDDRYQGAAEFANDLRECEKLLEALPSGKPMPAAGEPVAASPEPASAHIDPSDAVEQVAHRDSPIDDSVDPSPTQGLAKDFDSLAATMRLAAQVGMEAELDEFARSGNAASAETGEVQGTVVRTGNLKRGTWSSGPSPTPWSRRDQLNFAFGVGVAVIVAAGIILL